MKITHTSAHKQFQTNKSNKSSPILLLWLIVLACGRAMAHEAATPQGAGFHPRTMGRSGLGPGAQAPHYQPHIKRRTKQYEQMLKTNNFIKPNKVLRVSGKQRYIDIISVNITTCHDTARDWLCEQTADIILIQEHHMLYKGQFGKIPGYTLIFSPARRTMYSARGWETSGGVAILHKTNMFHIIKHKGIKQRGFNWAALHIQLEKDQEMIIVASYVRHGWEIDTISILGEVQDFLNSFTVPWIWGGDFNRSPEELLNKGLSI